MISQDCTWPSLEKPGKSDNPTAIGSYGGLLQLIELEQPNF